ncbi:hypothetical protein P9112_014135 [Eukaryota sp. TZLM1-RC]
MHYQSTPDFRSLVHAALLNCNNEASLKRLKHLSKAHKFSINDLLWIDGFLNPSENRLSNILLHSTVLFDDSSAQVDDSHFCNTETLNRMQYQDLVKDIDPDVWNMNTSDINDNFSVGFFVNLLITPVALFCLGFFIVSKSLSFKLRLAVGLGFFLFGLFLDITLVILKLSRLTSVCKAKQD